MRIAIDRESPIVGDERFSSPRVPPKHTVPPRATRTCPSPRGSIPCCSRAKVRRCSAHRLGRRVSSRGRKRVGLVVPGVREERNFMRKEPTAGSAAKGILGQLVEKLGDEEIGGHLRICAAAHKHQALQHVGRHTTLEQVVMDPRPLPWKGAIQDRASELPRISLPRTPVNRSGRVYVYVHKRTIPPRASSPRKTDRGGPP